MTGSTTHRMADIRPGPTFDSDLYSFSTLRLEAESEWKIKQAVDEIGLARWFAEQLRYAYQTGLRDGYAQGCHDQHWNTSPTHDPDRKVKDA